MKPNGMKPNGMISSVVVSDKTTAYCTKAKNGFVFFYTHTNTQKYQLFNLKNSHFFCSFANLKLHSLPK